MKIVGERGSKMVREREDGRCEREGGKVADVGRGKVLTYWMGSV